MTVVLLAMSAAADAQPALPRVKPITDLKSVAGQWDALAISKTAPSSLAVWTINEDGSYSVSAPGATSSDKRGTVRVSDGKLLFRTPLTGRTGSLTLHEGGGQRVLRGTSDDGVFVLELRPLVAAPTSARAVRRVGVLAAAMRASEPVTLQALRHGLSERGWTTGRNLTIEYRSAEGNPERLPGLAGELVTLKVDVVVTTCGPQIVALQQINSAIPMVVVCPDFGAAGLVVNLARPGQNITGVTLLGRELIGKRLEILRAAVPKVSRVGFLWRSLYDRTFFGQEMEGAAQRLGFRVLSGVEVRGGATLAEAFAAMAHDGADAVMVPADPLTTLYHHRVVELALAHRLPTMFDGREFVDAGGLLSYGPATAEILARVAGLVDKILRGTKPGDLPVEQPTKLELVVNLRTARALGLTIPPTLLQRADHLID